MLDVLYLHLIIYMIKNVQVNLCIYYYERLIISRIISVMCGCAMFAASCTSS